MISGNFQPWPGLYNPFLLNRATKQILPVCQKLHQLRISFRMFECCKESVTLKKKKFFNYSFQLAKEVCDASELPHHVRDVQTAPCESLAAACESGLKRDCFKVAFSLFLLFFLQIFSLQQHLLSQPRRSKQMCHYLMWWANPLNQVPAPPWQVVLDALFKPWCKNSLNPPGSGN